MRTALLAFGSILLAGVLHPRGDALHGDDQRVRHRGVVVVLGRVEAEHLLGPRHHRHVPLGVNLAILDVAQTLEVLNLDDVERREVDAAHGELVFEGVDAALSAVGRLRRQQVGVLGYLEHDVDGADKRLAELLAKAVVLLLDELLLVEPRDGGVRLGEDHLYEVHGDPEERPGFVHLPERLELPLLLHPLESLRDAEPDGEMEPRLGPREDPGDGAQRGDARVTLALRRARADVERAELLTRGGLEKVGVELGRLEHNLAIPLAGHLRHGGHGAAPLVAGRERRREGVLQSRGGVEVERVEAVLVLAEVLLDDLALNGDPEAPVDGSRRLRQDGEVRGPAASSNGPSAAVEQREFHPKLVGNLRGVFLPLVQRPSRGHTARVFARV